MHHCEICKVTIKNKCHMERHYNSKKHKDKQNDKSKIQIINNGLKDYIEFMESMQK